MDDRPVRLESAVEQLRLVVQHLQQPVAVLEAARPERERPAAAHVRRDPYDPTVVLSIIGLKMAAQDFRYSRPGTLFIALAPYGIALIAAPRLRRNRSDTAPVTWIGLQGKNPASVTD